MSDETLNLPRREFEPVVYELHADKLEEISKKYQAIIGYDYDKAVEKRRKKREKQRQDDDVGGEVMAMAYLQARRTAAAKDKSNLANAPTLSEEEQAFLVCVHAVAHEDCKIKPTEQEAYQSTAAPTAVPPPWTTPPLTAGWTLCAGGCPIICGRSTPVTRNGQWRIRC